MKPRTAGTCKQARMKRSLERWEAVPRTMHSKGQTIQSKAASPACMPCSGFERPFNTGTAVHEREELMTHFIAMLQPPEQTSLAKKPKTTGKKKKQLLPTLAVGLLDFKVNVVLARLEADFSDQPPSIPAVPNHQVSLQCPTAEYPCSAQPRTARILSGWALQGYLVVGHCRDTLRLGTPGIVGGWALQGYLVVGH